MIINDDVIEALKTLEDNSVDSILTDPPYAISMDKKWDTWKTLFDFQDWMFDVATEAYRVVRPGGTVAAFAAARTYQHTAIAFERAGFVIRDMIEWVYWSKLSAPSV